jgi:uncharacterized protein YneF (UPF0154 family)
MNKDNLLLWLLFAPLAFIVGIFAGVIRVAKKY